MNSLYQQLNQSTGANNLISMLKSSGNPQQMLMNLMSSNPQVAAVMKEVQANGGDAKSLFYRKAKEMGVDPQTILNQLKFS